MRKLYVLLLCATLTGCASTKVSSLKDPRYEGVRFSRVLVFGQYEKIATQKAFEDDMVEDLRSRHIDAKPSY